MGFVRDLIQYSCALSVSTFPRVEGIGLHTCNSNFEENTM